jgi:hypothetical protein
MLAVTMTIALLHSTSGNSYLFAQRVAFADLFMPSGTLPGSETGFGAYSAEFVTIDAFISHLNDIAQTYRNLAEISPDYQVLIDSGPRMTVRVFDQLSVHKLNFRSVADKSTAATDYVLLPGDLGPFNQSIPLSLMKSQTFDRLLDVDVHVRFESANLLPPIPECVLWDFGLHYDFSQRGSLIRLLMTPTILSCPSQTADVSDVTALPLFWLSLIGIGLAAVMVALSLRRILKIFRVKRDFPEIPFKSVVGLMDMWTFFSLSSALFTLASCIVVITYMTYDFDYQLAVNMLVGLSAMLNCISIVRYFEFTPKFYMLILTLRRGFPAVVRFTVGVAPVFFGYAILGTCLFGSYSRLFLTFDSSCVTLFSVLNGDLIHDSFDDVFRTDPFLALVSRLYLYSFVCLFIYAVLNVFIHLMEEGYYSAKDKPQPNARFERIVNRILGRASTVNGISTLSVDAGGDPPLEQPLLVMDRQYGDDVEHRGTPAGRSHPPSSSAGSNVDKVCTLLWDVHTSLQSREDLMLSSEEEFMLHMMQIHAERFLTSRSRLRTETTS